jgi:hypothetical protein
MEQEKEKIGIETGDFITPKKAITISTISLVIWFVTGLSFKVLSVLFVNIPYQSYALVVSLSLSIFFSVYIVRKLVMNADMFMKIIIGVLNTILIYTSANGAQATYSFLSPPDKTTESSAVQKGSLIPFLDARPWIPDKFLMAENESLMNENKKLLSEKGELARQNGQLQIRINLLKDSIQHSPDGIRKENLLLHDSIAMLATNLTGCQKQNEELSIRLKKMQSESNNPKTRALQDSLNYSERLNMACQKNNIQMAKQLESLRGRIQQFNTRQEKWRQRTIVNVSGKNDPTIARNQEIVGSIKRNVNNLMNDATYYDFLFLTPINTK